jgi:HSP20 family protein
MTIMKYRPQASFASPFNALVNDFFNRDIGHFLGHDDVKRHMPGVNIVERSDRFDLEMQAPGFAKEDIKLHVENDVLTISAEKTADELQENERYTRREFSTASFSRSFSLPDTVNVEGITAKHSDGLLRVSIPKAEAHKPKARAINIG